MYLLPDAVGGNNSDYDFVDKELYDLFKRQERRKVLFVLSDGHVACQTDYSTINHNKLIKQNISHYEKKCGVETVGIGIQSSAVKDIYKKNVVVEDVSELV